MYRELSYDKCISFIERCTDIKLFGFQKDMLRAFCEGREVRTSRACGRSLVAKAFGEYIAHVYDRNDYETEPELVISWEEAVGVGLISEDHVSNVKKSLGEERFKQEYCG